MPTISTCVRSMLGLTTALALFSSRAAAQAAPPHPAAAPPSAPAAPAYPAAGALPPAPPAPTYAPAAPPQPQYQPPAYTPLPAYPGAAYAPGTQPAFNAPQLQPPARIRYVEGRPIPPGYHLETQVRKGLVIAGALVFGIPYGFSVSVAGSSSRNDDRYLFIPVVGPFIDLAGRKDENRSNDEGTRFMLTFDGLAQTAGAVMLIVGLVAQQKILERDDAPIAGKPRPTFAWGVAPRSFGKHGAGIGLGGEF